MRRSITLGCLLAVLTAVTGTSIADSLFLSVDQSEVRVGATGTRMYYLQWRGSENEEWKNLSDQNLPDNECVWMRAVFEPDDGSEWEVPPDVKFLYSPLSMADSSLTPILDQMADGDLALRPPPEPFASATVPYQPQDPETAPKKNQATATPQPWHSNFYWVRASDNRTIIWRVKQDGAHVPELVLSEGNLLTGYVLSYVLDLTGDDVPDLIWRRPSDNHVVAWMMAADGHIDESKELNSGGGPGWALASVIDMNKDGILDLLWRRDDNRNVAWLMAADGSVHEIKVIYEGGTPGWILNSVLDLDKDGTDDLLFVRPSDNRVVAWLMAADASIKEIKVVYAGGTPGWTLKTVLDLDDDGTDDLLFVRPSDNRVVAWLMAADASIKEIKVVYAGGTPNWTLNAVADLNNDGIHDLLFTRTDNRTVVWFMAEDSSISEIKVVYAGGTPGWTMQTFYDVNNDSVRDIAFYRPSDGRTVAWLLSAAGDIVEYLVLKPGDFAGWSFITVLPAAN